MNQSTKNVSKDDSQEEDWSWTGKSKADFCMLSQPFHNESPIDLFSQLADSAAHAFLFEVTEEQAIRYSILGFDPLLRIIFQNGDVCVHNRENNSISKKAISNPIKFLDELIARYSESLDFADLDLPFIGGLFGYMGYGASTYLDAIPQQDKDPLEIPDAYYGLYDTVLIFDHAKNELYISSFRGEKYAQNIFEKVFVDRSIRPSSLNKNIDANDVNLEDIESSFSKKEYSEAFSRTKEFIRQGEAFQIVLSQRFSIPCNSKCLDIYKILQNNNPSPYSYYLKFPDFVYLGSSPETFLHCDKAKVMLKAIAGTRPRGGDSKEDNLLIEQLQNDEKELAEHYMLVDLARNDLGRVCSPGSIHLENLAAVNKFEHVMHMATTVKGELLPDKSCFDAFQSCFPAGTVSGAPKIRAMQLLSEIEPEKRGIYAGAIGYFDVRGNIDSAIAIRSALIKDGNAHINSGGGIVYDSELETEYQESLNKAKSILGAIKLAEKISNECSNN